MTYSIINISQLEGATRLDAEYYQPIFTRLLSMLKSSNFIKLGDISFVTDGEHGTPILDESSSIKYFSGQHVADGYLQFQGINHISRYTDEKNKRARLCNNNILMSIVGTVGKTALVRDEDLPGNTDRNIATIKITSNKYLPEYITSFLMSKYGKFQTYRECAGNVQPIIILSKVRDILIPVVSIKNQTVISNLFRESMELRKLSEIFTNQASQLLSDRIELKAGNGPCLYSIACLSKCCRAARVDAEFYHPKYDFLFNNINKHNPKKLGDIVTMTKGFEPGSGAYQDKGKLFIRVSSLNKFGIDSKDQKYLSEEQYSFLCKRYRPGVGEVLLTKDATPGIAYVLKEPIEGIVSSGILRLKVKDGIEPEYLALCLNSVIGKWQAERDSGGSIIAHWKPEQISNMLIPVLPKEVQTNIANLVKQSHEARKKSKELLDLAKKKVEDLIESGIS